MKAECLHQRIGAPDAVITRHRAANRIELAVGRIADEAQPHRTYIASPEGIFGLSMPCLLIPDEERNSAPIVPTGEAGVIDVNPFAAGSLTDASARSILRRGFPAVPAVPPSGMNSRCATVPVVGAYTLTLNP